MGRPLRKNEAESTGEECSHCGAWSEPGEIVVVTDVGTYCNQKHADLHAEVLETEAGEV